MCHRQHVWCGRYVDLSIYVLFLSDLLNIYFKETLSIYITYFFFFEFDSGFLICDNQGYATIVKGQLAFKRKDLMNNRIPIIDGSANASSFISFKDALSAVDRRAGEVVGQIGVGQSFGEASLFGRSLHRYLIRH